MKHLSLFFVLAWTLSSAALAVTIPVTGGSTPPATTLQDAIDSATTGDVVEIADSLTYNEDIGFQTDGVTLQAAAGQTPTVVSQFTRNDLTDFGFLGGLGAGLGCVISANDVTIEGLHFDCLDPVFAFLGQLSVGGITIEGGANIVIRNCEIEYSAVGPSAPGGGTHGDQPCLLIMTSFLNSGAAWLDAGDPIDNVLIEDCAIHNSALGLYVGDLQGALGGFGVGPIDPAGPPTNVTIRDCDFSEVNGSMLEMDSVEPMLIEDCTVHDTTGGLEIGGGIFTLRRLVLTDVRDGQGIDLNGEDGTGSTSIFTGDVTDVTIEDSIICNAETHGIEARDANLTITGTIIAHNGGSGVWWRPDNWDSDFLPARGGATVPATLTIDQCDIYQPESENAFTTTGAIDPAIISNNTMTITNSILTADTFAINNGVTFTASTTSTLIATHNDLFAPTSISNTGGATLIDTANLNEDPSYRSPSGCPDISTSWRFYGYYYNILSTAGNAGQEIGSQGIIIHSHYAVDDWALYE